MAPQHMHVSLTNHSMQRWLLVAVTCVAVFSVTASACGAPRTDSERVEYWVVRLGLDLDFLDVYFADTDNECFHDVSSQGRKALSARTSSLTPLIVTFIFFICCFP